LGAQNVNAKRFWFSRRPFRPYRFFEGSWRALVAQCGVLQWTTSRYTSNIHAHLHGCGTASMFISPFQTDLLYSLKSFLLCLWPNVACQIQFFKSNMRSWRSFPKASVLEPPLLLYFNQFVLLIMVIGSLSSFKMIWIGIGWEIWVFLNNLYNSY